MGDMTWKDWLAWFIATVLAPFILATGDWILDLLLLF